MTCPKCGRTGATPAGPFSSLLTGEILGAMYVHEDGETCLEFSPAWQDIVPARSVTPSWQSAFAGWLGRSST